MEGYKRKLKEVDVSWWLDQIKAGEKYREESTNQTDWKKYRAYYNNAYAKKDDLITKNIFFIMKRSIVPRLYFRNPTISVLPRKPGPEFLALARLLERIYNTLLKPMDIKQQLKRMVDCGFTTGTGVGKLGFGAEFTPTPEPDITRIPVDSYGRRSEFQSGIIENMPWFRSIPTESFILPHGVQSFANSYFQAHKFKRFKDDLLNDPRISSEYKKTLKFSGRPADKMSAELFTTPRERVDLIEIRDRRTQKVMILADNGANLKPLIYADDELQTENSSPFYTYVPNPKEETFWGLEDAKILEQYQMQLNEIKTKQHLHMRSSIMKILVEDEGLSESEAEKISSQDIGAIVRVTNVDRVKLAQASRIPDDLFQMETTVEQDMRDVMGFSRNQFGEFQARSHGPTATEVDEVKQSSELRLDERRDSLSDILVNVFTDVKKIIFRHWTQEQVIKVAGPQGLPVWVKFKPQMLQQGDYEVKIEPDSAVPETKAIREARALRYFQTLLPLTVPGPDMLPPAVSKDKLLKYLINQLPGVSTEDLLTEQQEEPISGEQFVDSFKQSPNIQPPIEELLL